MNNPPYYIFPMLETLGNPGLDDQRRRNLAARVALNVGDTEALRRILGLDPEEFKDFYSEMEPISPSTEDTIDTFLQQYGGGRQQPDTLQYAPAMDYASMLEKGTSDPLEDQSADEPETESGNTDDNVADDTDNGLSEENNAAQASSASLSESLAKVMIKKHNYKKALEIIMALSLNNPEKSVYFADQIRFLRKLIYAQNRNNQRN